MGQSPAFLPHAAPTVASYRRLKTLPQLPQRISPGLYPPIRNFARQCGQVTEYPPDLRFTCHLRGLVARRGIWAKPHR